MAKSAKTSPPSIVPSGFFAFRTPLLPWAELTNFSSGLLTPSAEPAMFERALAEDKKLLRERLRDILARAEIREALFVASPSLDESVELWMRDPESERGQKAERSIVRYFARMAGRPTPFGLFAGCSVGKIGERTRIAIKGREEYGRHTRLDMDYLFSLTEALARDDALSQALTYRPNSSLYRTAGRFRYAEARLEGKIRSYHLVAVDLTDYLVATLARAQHGAYLGDLADALVDSEVSAEEAREYVKELVLSQLLVPDLAPPVSGPEPIHQLVNELKTSNAANDAVDKLDEARIALERLDEGGIGQSPEGYRAIAKLLDAMPAKAELPRLFQVDMVKPARDACLGPEVLREIVRGVELLHRFQGSKDGLGRFREAFGQRYEGREVRLVEALDEEAGIGFDAGTGPGVDASPLLEGLAFPATGENEAKWGAQQAFLLGKLDETLRNRKRELVLDAEDLKKLERQDPLSLPDAFAVVGTLAAPSAQAIDEGKFRFHFHGASGPSGALLLGRFCHGDAELETKVREHLRREESLRPDAILAEIVHLPEGRIGNVLLRPVLRDYEIPFLGRSGASIDKQIPVTDLLVSVSGGRVILRSETLGREVIPRLTSAHNYMGRLSLGMYRFLCSLQRQGTVSGLGWSWGPLEGAPFLPRVATGRLVLALARWLVTGPRLKALQEAKGIDRFHKITALREEQGMPRMVSLADADNLLPVDFDNVLSVETFLHLIKSRTAIQLVETFPGEDELCAFGPEGRFAHELVVPFVRNREATVPAPLRKGPSLRRSFPAGSEWLYAKLYTGTSSVDELLRQVVRPMVDRAAGAFDSWFFIRYGDPDWHLRLRFQGDPRLLHGQVMPLLLETAEPFLRDGCIWRVQIDTYEREVERYGGPEGMLLAEELFYHDSEAVLAIVDELSGDAGSDARWRLTLRGMDMMLCDLGMDLAEKHQVVKEARAAYGRELGADTFFAKQLGGKYRKERLSLEALMDASKDEESDLWPGFVALRRRSEACSKITRELREHAEAGRLAVSLCELAKSYLHMHANRLLRAAARPQELVIYDFLERIYEAKRAREKET